METSRQLYAAVDLLTSLVAFGLWWFAFARFRKTNVFLILAVTHTISAALSIDNAVLAFVGHPLISFSSSERMLTFATVTSYVSMIVWIVEVIAYIFLVRWILRKLKGNTNV